MSDKSGLSAQITSLSKGVGALHGVGLKFSPATLGTRSFSTAQKTLSDTLRRTEYLLSIWHEGQNGARVWRGYIETAAQQRLHFGRLAELNRLLCELGGWMGAEICMWVVTSLY